MDSRSLKITDNLFVTKLNEGTTYEKEVVVCDNDLATQLGTAHIELISTSSLIAYVEQCCAEMVDEYLLNGLVTVSAEVNFKHLFPVKTGETIYCKGVLKFIETNRLFFDVVVMNDKDISVGIGAHERYIVNRKSFLGETE
nr:hotdog domain-containing protein [uncultured Carboxylicivirga sp.]